MLGLRLNVWTAIVVFVLAVAYMVVSAKLRPGREEIVEPAAVEAPKDEAADADGEDGKDGKASGGSTDATDPTDSTDAEGSTDAEDTEASVPDAAGAGAKEPGDGAGATPQKAEKS